MSIINMLVINTIIRLGRCQRFFLGLSLYVAAGYNRTVGIAIVQSGCRRICEEPWQVGLSQTPPWEMCQPQPRLVHTRWRSSTTGSTRLVDSIDSLTTCCHNEHPCPTGTPVTTPPPPGCMR